MASKGTETYMAFPCNFKLLSCRPFGVVERGEAGNGYAWIEYFARNRLLRALGEEGFSRLASRMEMINLPVGYQLVGANTPISRVCFIESGIASSVARTEGGKSMENMLVGREGMTGWPVLLGARTTPDETTMGVAGEDSSSLQPISGKRWNGTHAFATCCWDISISVCFRWVSLFSQTDNMPCVKGCPAGC